MSNTNKKQRSGKAVNEAQNLDVDANLQVGEVETPKPAPAPPTAPQNKGAKGKQGKVKEKLGKAKGGQVTESDYKRLVLNPNAELKKDKKTFGYCITYLLQFATPLKLEAKQVSILKAAKKDLKKSGLLEVTKPNAKTGNFSPFYVLQGIYRLMHPTK